VNFGNAQFDLAELRTEQEREAQVAAAGKALRTVGAMACEDCAELITRERRLAMPSATRCISCQTRFERQARRR